MVRIERQLGEIDVLACDLHGMNRSVAGRDLHHRLRIGQALEILVVDFFFGGFERRDQAFAAGRGLGHHLGLFRAGAFEQHRLVGAFDDGAEAGQWHRFVVDLDLAHVDEPVHEGAQPEFF